MSYLIDTHVFLWARIQDSQLGPHTWKILTDPKNRIYLSAVVSWEISIKWRSGKLKLADRPHSIVRRSMEENGLFSLPITHDHSLQVGDLPDHHHDPFDRLLVAQALVENLTLLTADPQIKAYPARIHWALD